MADSLFGPASFTFGGTPAPAPTKTPAQQMQEWADAQDVFNTSPVGTKWNATKEAEAAYARKQADAIMANAKRQLDTQVESLRQQGRIAEAEIKLKQGEAEIAKQRFAWEQQIKQQELGLQQEDRNLARAEAIAKYSSTPDQTFMRSDLMSALGRAGQGLGPTPYGTQGTPQAKTYADFEAIAGPAGSLASGGAAPAGQGSGGGGSGNGTDPRISAATAVMKAIPPSPGVGHDESDQAALSAINNIWHAALPGTLERMRPGQRSAFGAGLSRLGYVPGDAIADMQRAAPGQRSARLA